MSTPEFDSRLHVVAVRALRNEGYEDFNQLQLDLIDQLNRGTLSQPEVQLKVEEFWVGKLRSAVGFTLHHIVAMQLYCSGLVTGLCASGIFIGGAAWSWCYLRYKSIWPGYLSHAIVDLAVFGVGYHIIFLR